MFVHHGFFIAFEEGINYLNPSQVLLAISKSQ